MRVNAPKDTRRSRSFLVHDSVELDSGILEPWRIIAWNINHRIREKAIPDQMIEAIVSLGPDVIVLTEYVHGTTRTGFSCENSRNSDLATGSFPIPGRARTTC